MKIPNYDPGSSKSDYKQGHPCMPADVFRMLICGPSNSGKTNTLLHMLYELLEYDKIYLFSKNLHQNKYQDFLQEFAEKINPQVGYEVIEAHGDEIIPLEELPEDNQKIVVFDDLVCEKNQNDIINYFINGRHKNCCIFVFSDFSPRENKRIADEIGVDHDALNRATDKNYSFFYYDKPQKLMKKILMKIYNGVY